MQTKVTQTRIHRVDSFPNKRQERTVAEGKFVLVGCVIQEAIIAKSTVNDKVWIKQKGTEGTLATYYKPIIISEIEKIKDGDWFYSTEFNIIDQLASNGVIDKTKCFKILVLSEQFSPKQLQMIVDGKLKDGDKVLVECDKQWDVDSECPTGLRQTSNHSLIKLNSSNHVTIHKVEEKMYTRDEVHQIIISFAEHWCMDIVDVHKWFEQNVK